MVFNFEAARKTLFKNGYSQKQVDSLNAVMQEINNYALTKNQAAYVLASIYHEADLTWKKGYGKYDIFVPVEEGDKGKGRPYGTWYSNSKKQEFGYTDGTKKVAYLKADYPFLYYGRGFIQITWWSNYKWVKDELKIDILNKPCLALDIKVSAKIAVYGMLKGKFTGKKLSDYINNTKVDFVNARRIVNGTDKASHIAGLANKFLAVIK